MRSPLHPRRHPIRAIRASPLVLLLGLALLAGCATTRIVETWQAPGLTAEDLRFGHVVAIAVLPEVGRRRIVEDALAAAATRTKVTAAYQILDGEDRRDIDALREGLEQRGIDGAVVVELVGVEEQDTYVPGSTRIHPGGFYGHYGAVGTVIYDPGYVRTDTYVLVETRLYDVSSGRLLWSGISRTMNPSSANDLVDDIVKAARAELRDEGLLP